MAEKLKNGNKDAEWESRPRDKRQEPRFAMAIAIELSGVDGQGEAFCEQVMTSSASEWGFGFNLAVDLGVNAIVAVRVMDADAHCPPDGRPVLFQIVRVEREKDSWKMGAWKMDAEREWCVGLRGMVEAGK